MTQPRKKRSAPAQVTPTQVMPPAAAQVNPQEVSATAARLIQNCSEMKLRVNWFGTTSKVDEEMAVDMLKDTQADRHAVSISKRLFRVKDEALTRVKEARQLIQEHVNAWTIPKLAVRAVDPADVGSGLTRKDAGVRLIQKKDMKDFDERLQYLIGNLRAAVAKLQEKMPAIKAKDREQLGRLYNDKDYPTDVTKLVSVEVTYQNTQVDLDWQALCPEIYAREQRAAHVRMEQVVRNAAEEFSERFVQYIQQVVNQLGARERVNPSEPDLKRYEDAEIVERATHEVDDTVPVGMVAVQLRYTKEGEKRQTSEWLPPMAPADFERRFGPYKSEERRKIFASSLDGLKTQLEHFRNVGDVFGPYKELVHRAVDQVRDKLSAIVSDQDSVRLADELRNSNYTRDQLAKSLNDAASIVRDAIGIETKVRRRVLDITIED